jgi:hypothetical protein
MKKLILMTLLGAVGFGSKAQTNRDQYTNMQTARIYEDERRGGQISNGVVKLNVGSDNQEINATENLSMNTVQSFEGYSSSPNNYVQRYFGDARSALLPRDLGDLKQYDTSKNNGHCLGCGSGTLTDEHPGVLPSAFLRMNGAPKNNKLAATKWNGNSGYYNSVANVWNSSDYGNNVIVDNSGVSNNNIGLANNAIRMQSDASFAGYRQNSANKKVIGMNRTHSFTGYKQKGDNKLYSSGLKKKKKNCSCK